MLKLSRSILSGRDRDLEDLRADTDAAFDEDGAEAYAARVAELLAERTFLSRGRPVQVVYAPGPWPLRFIPAGEGDADGARDALRSSRAGITAMEEMHRSSRFESDNPHSISPAGFKQVANAVGGCPGTISGIHELNQELWHANNERLRLAQRIAELEARHESG